MLSLYSCSYKILYIHYKAYISYLCILFFMSLYTYCIHVCILSLLLHHYSAISINILRFYSHFYCISFLLPVLFLWSARQQNFRFLPPFSFPSRTSRTFLLAASYCCCIFVTIALSFERAWPLSRWDDIVGRQPRNQQQDSSAQQSMAMAGQSQSQSQNYWKYTYNRAKSVHVSRSNSCACAAHTKYIQCYCCRLVASHF